MNGEGGGLEECDRLLDSATVRCMSCPMKGMCLFFDLNIIATARASAGESAFVEE